MNLDYNIVQIRQLFNESEKIKVNYKCGRGSRNYIFWTFQSLSTYFLALNPCVMNKLRFYQKKIKIVILMVDRRKK